MKRTNRQGRGFTLVELLVAVGILAVTATLGWRGLEAIVQARLRLGTELEQTRSLQLALAQIQADCEQLVPATLLPRRARLVVTPGRLLLVRTLADEGQPARLLVVAYRLRDGVLSRRASAATRDLARLDLAWAAMAEDATSGGDVILQSGLAGMAVRLWMSDGSGWRTPGIDAEAASATTVASGIEVVFGRQGAGPGIRKIFFLGPG